MINFRTDSPSSTWFLQIRLRCQSLFFGPETERLVADGMLVTRHDFTLHLRAPPINSQFSEPWEKHVYQKQRFYPSFSWKVQNSFRAWTYLCKYQVLKCSVFKWFNIEGFNVSSPIIQPLLLDHGQVTLPAMSLRSIVVSHGSRHLLIVHLLRPVHLHVAPGLGQLQGVGHLETRRLFIHPGHHCGIVVDIVKHVPGNNIVMSIIFVFYGIIIRASEVDFDIF